MIDLDDLLDNVKDRESFLVFVRALIHDRQDELEKKNENSRSACRAGANGWENGTIESYLDAAAAWMEDWMGREHELPEESSWRSFARFLYAGK